ncbi:GDSL-like Lipase/Acylhydrolase [Enhygromyxa salina]|uniref:GDSL-like Lipase/Acylhydrolase n=1 Tax=Enhygromyxa salina TaxID=215803 RepID=A0A2S9XUF8_9BACT|nr:GDSL-like Lipase/Acylhydrolase [Enhygromyxa salina]
MLCTLALGCGVVTCGEAPSRVPGASALVGQVDPVTPKAAPPGTEASDEHEVLPAYTDEALAARVSAQRVLLGNDLFEDIEGNPVAPRIELMAEDEAAGSIDDDILLSLPGSGGFGLGGAAGSGSETAANGNALGLYAPIENPRDDPALAHFHAALSALAAGTDDDGKVRVLVYGASHTQADIYPGYFRAYLQSRFGDGGQGFVSLNRVNKWYRYQDWSIEETRGWKSEYAQRQSSRKDGFYGLLGASGSSDSKRDNTKIVPRHELAVASEYELYYLAQPGGGSLRLFADGKKIATVDTGKQDGKSVTKPAAGYYAFTLDEGPHEIEVRVVGDGEVRLFGLDMERASSGVVIDTLGISGTRAANMLHWDQDVWTSNIQRRDPDLYTLFYGTNEATDENQSMASYRANLREVLTRLRAAAPEASCLIIGPGDFPREIEEDVWIPRPRVAEIVEAQRDIAYEMGCGFWDTLAFMGGVNSMHEWATSRPQMASRDHIHFTKRGYVRLGMAVIDAMMADFDRGSH